MSSAQFDSFDTLFGKDQREDLTLDQVNAMLAISQNRNQVYLIKAKVKNVDSHHRFWLEEENMQWISPSKGPFLPLEAKGSFTSPIRQDSREQCLVMVLNGKDLGPLNDETKEAMRNCELYFTVKFNAYAGYMGYKGISGKVEKVGSTFVE
jgi:hypothetical protein